MDEVERTRKPRLMLMRCWYKVKAEKRASHVPPVALVSLWRRRFALCVPMHIAAVSIVSRVHIRGFLYQSAVLANEVLVRARSCMPCASAWVSLFSLFCLVWGRLSLVACLRHYLPIVRLVGGRW